jgi:XTP/dITP diphosphohydrolase
MLASSNPKKSAEIQQLLSGLSIELIPQIDLNIPDIEETGLTFVENAILKARHAAQLSGLPALADDSGLSVDCLGGAPGVYSARYAGPGASSADLIAKLLKEMERVDAGERTARFHCVIVLMRHPHDPAPILCHGVWEGRILTSSQGRHGFGYDPIFYVPTHDCSAADLDPAEKNRLSHRAQAITQLLQKGIDSIRNQGLFTIR